MTSKPRIDPALAVAITQADTDTLKSELKGLQVTEGEFARKLNTTRRTIEALKIEIRGREQGSKAA